jgi:hypothetical protein
MLPAIPPGPQPLERPRVLLAFKDWMVINRLDPRPTSSYLLPGIDYWRRSRASCVHSRVAPADLDRVVLLPTVQLEFDG